MIVIDTEPIEMAAAVKILVVDDDPVNRQALKGMLTAQGYALAFAENGLDVLGQVERDPPALVLMALTMPVMDGLEAIRRIKQQQLIPIIFLMTETDENVLARCLAMGGDDFITQPCNPVLLKAKIEALLRTRELYHELQAQKEALAAHEERRREEHRLAERIYSRIARTSRSPMRNVKYLLRPMEIFSGDLILTATMPSGGQQFLVGDFSGHGLPAAIGAMVVFDVFYSMAAKGFAIGKIVVEINRKLWEILPTGHFFAACLVELDPRSQLASVWNGGLPPVCIRRDKAGISTVIPSAYLPLGIVPAPDMEPGPSVIQVSPGTRIVVHSDGVTEAHNPQGELYGAERLEAVFRAIQNPEALFDGIVRDIEEFMGGAPQNDDISLLEITCGPGYISDGPIRSRESRVTKPPMHWRLSLELGASALRDMDPLPPILQLVVDLQGLQSHRERLYTVLAELYSNALEHGLLGLDSSLKHSSEGFADYYQRRQKALGGLSKGRLRMDFQHESMKDGGGQFTLRMADSGAGFDYQRVLPELGTNGGFHGRGIKLVRSLCEKVTYFGEGNEVEAVFRWA